MKKETRTRIARPSATRPNAASASPITVDRLGQDDRASVLSLHVSDEQSSFVASNRDSLEEAEENPACVPLVIRSAGEAVGFAMYALDEDDGNYWIYRLMIDVRFQRKGYGRAALMQIIAMLAEHPDCSCVVLGVKPGNVQARRLYEDVGFQPTGDVIDGEIVMRYDL